MGAVSKRQNIDGFAKQIIENLNMVYATAASGKRPFAEADERFEELYALLRFYRCDEAAAEQAANFAGIAYYRGEYVRALELTEDAVETCPGEEGKAAYARTPHDMAYRLLAVGLGEPQDKVLLERVQNVLQPGDYRRALQNAAANIPAEEEARQTAVGLLRRLGLEALRQAIRLEPTAPNESLSLLREALPWLNEKRAVPVRLEIQRLEKICHE